MVKRNWDLKVFKVVREKRFITFKELLENKELKGISKSNLSKVISKLERFNLIKVYRSKSVKIKGKGKPLLICDVDFEPLEIQVLNSLIRIVNKRLRKISPNSFSKVYGSLKDSHIRRLLEQRILYPPIFEKIVMEDKEDILSDVAITIGEDPKNKEFRKKFFKALSTIIKAVRNSKEYKSGKDLYPVLEKIIDQYLSYYGYVRASNLRNSAPAGIFGSLALMTSH